MPAVSAALGVAETLIASQIHFILFFKTAHFCICLGFRFALVRFSRYTRFICLSRVEPAQGLAPAG